MFKLHPQLALDTVFITDWKLSQVLLMDNRLFPWIILVPRLADLHEIHHLCAENRAILMEEMTRASHAMEQGFKTDKINVAAIGNIVSQLHVHIVARLQTDPAWPHPVWGSAYREPYATQEKADRVHYLKTLLS
jgi:diadenosine tetraphosphate (Ap4A) HIT family hydrolase